MCAGVCEYVYVCVAMCAGGCEYVCVYACAWVFKFIKGMFASVAMCENVNMLCVGARV